MIAGTRNYSQRDLFDAIEGRFPQVARVQVQIMPEMEPRLSRSTRST